MAAENYIYRKGLAPNTSTVISSKVKVYLGGTTATDSTQIGVMASFDPSESRSIEPVRGIGYGDQIAELVPGNTEPMSLSVNRTAQYLSTIYQAFGYKGGSDNLVRSLKHHKWPFDLRKEIVFSEMVSVADNTVTTASADATDQDSAKASLNAMVTVYEACWFSEWGTSYTSDTAIVQENCTIMVSDVHVGTPATPEQQTGNAKASARVVNYAATSIPSPVAAVAAVTSA